MEIPQQIVLAGIEFRTCDPPTHIFFDLQPNLPYRIWPLSWLHTVRPLSSGQYSRGLLCSSCQQLSKTQSRLSQSLYTLKEYATHLLGLHAPATEPGFGFCQQHLEFPIGLPSKYYPGPMSFLIFGYCMQASEGVNESSRLK